MYSLNIQMVTYDTTFVNRLTVTASTANTNDLPYLIWEETNGKKILTGKKPLFFPEYI